MMKFAGVILAGGKSRRFGEPKAFAFKAGLPFYHYSLQALEPFVSELVIVTSTALWPSFLREPISETIITDVKEYQGQGPLAGIYSAMEHIKADWYIVNPIDVPFIEQGVIDELLSTIRPGIQAVVPISKGVTQPLIGVYHSSVKETIKQQLELGYLSLHGLLDLLKVQYISLEYETPFININSKADYLQFIETEKGGGSL